MPLRVQIAIPSHPAAIEAVCEGLVQLNQWQLEHASDLGAPTPPSLYSSGAVYRREKGTERWQSIAELAGNGRRGDCEDLAAWRVAELRHYLDEPARVKIVKTARGTYHAVVERGDGSIEDPSRILYDLEHNHERTDS